MATDEFNEMLGPKCKHPKCVPAWDGEKARGMTADEIRRAYPRFEGVCPDCGENVIVYAAVEQYIGGDY